MWETGLCQGGASAVNTARDAVLARHAGTRSYPTVCPPRFVHQDISSKVTMLGSGAFGRGLHDEGAGP